MSLKQMSTYMMIILCCHVCAVFKPFYNNLDIFRVFDLRNWLLIAHLIINRETTAHYCVGDMNTLFSLVIQVKSTMRTAEHFPKVQNVIKKTPHPFLLFIIQFHPNLNMNPSLCAMFLR